MHNYVFKNVNNTNSWFLNEINIMVEILSYILFIAIYSVNQHLSMSSVQVICAAERICPCNFFPAAGPIFSNIIKKYLIFPEVYIKRFYNQNSFFHKKTTPFAFLVLSKLFIITALECEIYPDCFANQWCSLSTLHT